MKAVKKLKSRRGFSLAETLMAVLILLLVSTIVANGVPVAKNAYEKVVLSANAQTLLSSAVSALRDEVGTAWDVRVEDKTTLASGSYLTYYSAATGARTKLCVGSASIGDATVNTILVQDNYSESLLGSTGFTVSALGTARQLVQDGKNAGDTTLYVTCDSTITYVNGVVKFTNIEVKTVGGTSLAKLASIEITVASRHA